MRLPWGGPLLRSYEWMSDDPPLACVMDVRGVYQHLTGRAVAAGATIRVRHTVDQVLQENGRVLGVTVKNHVSERFEVRADITIDASGFARHLCDIPQLAQYFKGASPLEYHTGLFPSENYLERFSRDGLLLAGDAGGHGSTLVREGIRFAIYSGLMAQLEGEQKQVRLLGVSLSNLVPENGMSSQQIYTSRSLWDTDLEALS